MKIRDVFQIFPDVLLCYEGFHESEDVFSNQRADTMEIDKEEDKLYMINLRIGDQQDPCRTIILCVCTAHPDSSTFCRTSAWLAWFV